MIAHVKNGNPASEGKEYCGKEEFDLNETQAPGHQNLFSVGDIDSAIRDTIPEKLTMIFKNLQLNADVNATIKDKRCDEKVVSEEDITESGICTASTAGSAGANLNGEIGGHSESGTGTCLNATKMTLQ